MHLHFNVDACPMHSPFGFVHLTHQNLSVCALFCLISLAKANSQLLIYKYETFCDVSACRKGNECTKKLLTDHKNGNMRYKTFPCLAAKWCKGQLPPFKLPWLHNIISKSVFWCLSCWELLENGAMVVEHQPYLCRIRLIEKYKTTIVFVNYEMVNTNTHPTFTHISCNLVFHFCGVFPPSL